MVQASYLNMMQTATVGQGCCCGGSTPCVGLECLCRPRFFPGQLLTDEDLNRLERYIVSKDRLHNKYLHGTGVVCGLEVVCNPCDDTVTVRTGYAIGPCGEDIVVCSDTSVDVGDLVREFRHQKASQPDCGPYGRVPNKDCGGSTQDWVLAICYAESPSRGVTSLRPPSKSGCGCGCGGAKSNGSTTTSTSSCGCKTKTATPPQCEPTLTCEGYTFKLMKPPPKPTEAGRLTEFLGGSELGKRVAACLANILTQVTSFPDNPSNNDLATFCCTFKGELQDLILSGNIHDCTLGQRLSMITCPDPSDDNFTKDLAGTLTDLLQVAIDLFRDCICSALLPPCSTGSPDDCVPLATVTIRASDLHVLSICNWSARKFVVTFPMLGYWLGWIPIFDVLRQAMVNLCCVHNRGRFKLNDNQRVKYEQGAEAAPAAEAAQPAPAAGIVELHSTNAEVEASSYTNIQKGNKTVVSGLAEQYARKTTPLSGLEATVLGGLGLRDTQNGLLASQLELMNPLTALTLTHFAGPSAASVIPPEIARAFGQLFDRKSTSTDKTTSEASAPAPSKADNTRLAKLEAGMADLKKTVRSQKAVIERMRKVKKNG